MRNVFSVAAALAILAGCENGIAAPTHASCDAFLRQYGMVDGDTVDAGNGLRYIDIQAGSGAAAASGRVVDVNYSGYLVDGTLFDSSCPGNRTVLRVVLGQATVIQGFDLGMRGMRPDGVRRIIIPPELGYGSAPFGDIPANSTLIFDVELVEYPGD